MMVAPLPLGIPLASSGVRRLPLWRGRGAAAAQMNVSLCSLASGREVRS